MSKYFLGAAAAHPAAPNRPAFQKLLAPVAAFPLIYGDMFTPMFEQYARLKNSYPEAVIFFRLGDFYEMFFEDAHLCSRALGLTLTGRGKNENRVPMCGFPHHAASGYIAKLLAGGHRVAIVEQTEDPALAKTLVRRDVVRVFTPGTVYEDALLDSGETRYVVAVAAAKGHWAAARLDMAAGSFEVWPALAPSGVGRVLGGWGPAELICAESTDLPEGADAGTFITRRPALDFSPAEGAALLREHFGVANLAGFGLEGEDAAVAAAAALLRYAAATQLSNAGHVIALHVRTLSDRLYLDAATLKNLEIFEHAGPGGGTLFDVVNRTLTAMGARRVKQTLAEPFCAVDVIEKRLDAVTALYRDGESRHHLRELLRGCGDVERLAGRVALGTASPRDVAALGRSLALAEPLRKAAGKDSLAALGVVAADLVDVADLVTMVDEALVDDPPAALADGGVIRPGFCAELDDLRDRAGRARQFIAGLERTERERTGISSLKVSFNKVFGYYIEVTKANVARVPAEYIRKQTIANGERYITPELKEYEDITVTADERIAALEREAFSRLRADLAAHLERILKVARAAAELDAFASHAQTALENDFVRPAITDEPVLEIEDGRHAVIERFYLDEPFVPNDLTLDDQERFIILTGPNMAGKSTYLRQTAIITILAHAGSYVPARRARIGLTDRVFTRIGAADDLSRGRSTFLVEMNETAEIVNGATTRSLILLDEVGRGTSTYDGVSLAWAVAEYLAVNVGARTLFATHYHELAALAEGGHGVVNYAVSVREAGGRVHFLRRVVRGISGRSYGIQVARLAGLPPSVLARARLILDELEAGRGPRAVMAAGPQQALFPKRPPVLDEFLAALDPDSLTPREAQDALYRLKTLWREEGDPHPPAELRKIE